MKGNYEFLNDIDIDESEMIEKDLSEFRKEKIKRNVIKSIRKRKYKRNGVIAAGILCAFVGGLGILGAVNPAYAEELPIVGDIFKAIDKSRYGKYERIINMHEKYHDNSKEINITKESNGTSITLKDAVFDGKVLSYTYEIDCKEDLGENQGPFFVCYSSGSELYENEDYSSGICYKVGENKYIGRNDCILKKEQNEINVVLECPRIDKYSANYEGIDGVVRGEWRFDINLKAVENTKLSVDKSTENNGSKVIIDNIYKTSISSYISYHGELSDDVIEKWPGYRVYLSVQDDLGNVYRGEEGCMYTKCGVNKDYIKVCGNIEDEATKLIISPMIELANEYEEEYEIIRNENEFKSDAITFNEPIVIELEK